MQPNRIRLGTHGYSLVEMLLVLALVGVIASQATPAMSEYVGRHKTRRALDRFAADLAFARMSAVRSGEPVVVRFVGASGYRVEAVAGDAPVQREVGLGDDYAGVVLLPPAVSLEFNSRGMSASDLGRGYVVAALGELRDSLFITPAGRVYRDF